MRILNYAYGHGAGVDTSVPLAPEFFRKNVKLETRVPDTVLMTAGKKIRARTKGSSDTANG